MTISLGLDLDGVVGDYETSFREFVANAKGIRPEDLGPQKSWSYVDNEWVASEQEFLRLHGDAVSQGMFRNMSAFPGASKRLWQLSDDGLYIRIVTHRLGINGIHAAAAGDTVAFLERERIPYRDLCFVTDKTLVDADVYMDDAPHNINALRRAGKDVIIFDQLYNRHLDGTRVRNWDEAFDVLDQKLKGAA